jgi:hypothetical protein
VDRLRILPCTTHKCGHADNEQLAQIFVTHLGDMTEPLFAAARLLKWRQSQPGSELPPRSELMPAFGSMAAKPNSLASNNNNKTGWRSSGSPSVPPRTAFRGQSTVNPTMNRDDAPILAFGFLAGFGTEAT